MAVTASQESFKTITQQHSLIELIAVSSSVNLAQASRFQIHGECTKILVEFTVTDALYLPDAVFHIHEVDKKIFFPSPELEF